jgi:outer membrane protein
MNALFTRTRLIAVAVACAAASSAFAGDFMVRGRVLQLDPANDGTGTAAAVSANSKLIWEIDASYFFTPNVAVEVIATTPQKHSVYLSGNRIGTLRHLPPTVTLQYHFAPTNPTVRPYIGAGLNYTRFSAVNLNVGGTPVTLDKSSWGYAFQIGADFPITQNLSFNVDFKKIDINADAKLGGTPIGTVKIDPAVFGIGIGYRF